MSQPLLHRPLMASAFANSLLFAALWIGCSTMLVLPAGSKPNSMATETEPKSGISHSTHILSAHIRSASPGDWQPGPRQTRERSVQLHLEIDAVLKGRVAALSRLVKIRPRNSGMPSVLK